MPAPDSTAVVEALSDLISFGLRFGLKELIAPLENFRAHFESTKPTLKVLQNEVKPLSDQLYLALEKILKDEALYVRPGMEEHAKEFRRIYQALSAVIFPPPPQPAEFDAGEFRGSDKLENKTVPYWGEATVAREIVERTIDVVQRYSEVIGRRDFDAAYELTGNGLRAWMNKKRFITEHEKAAKTYGGPALEFHIERFQIVHADPALRKKIKSEEQWPKLTSKEDCRSCVTGFWIRNRAEQTGCYGALMITEEQGEYRIVKFDFYSS